MSQKTVPYSRILLIGLETQLSTELSLVLSSDGHMVHESLHFDSKSNHLRREPADMIFCASKPECCARSRLAATAGWCARALHWPHS
jgi:hypothetical protein